MGTSDPRELRARATAREQAAIIAMLAVDLHSAAVDLADARALARDLTTIYRKTPP